jgi:hypothetical protein
MHLRLLRKEIVANLRCQISRFELTCIKDETPCREGCETIGACSC